MPHSIISSYSELNSMKAKAPASVSGSYYTKMDADDPPFDPNNKENNYPTQTTNYNTLPTKEAINQNHKEDNENNEMMPAPPSRIIGGIRSLIYRIFKFFFTIFLILFNSVLLCYASNYIFGKYVFVSQNLHFTQINSTSLATSVYFNCTKYTKNKYKQCKELSSAKYTIVLTLEFGNRIHTDDVDNIPVDLMLYTKGNNVNQYEQLFYFEKIERIAETMNKILLSPFRLLGFFNNRKEKMEFIETYDNYYEPIEKAEIVIHKPDLNIHYANISFKPMNGWISTLYSSFKYLIILPMFCIFCGIQLVLMIIFRCTARRVFKSKTKIKQI